MKRIDEPLPSDHLESRCNASGMETTRVSQEERRGEVRPFSVRHSCGEGPWYVFLMLNVAPKSSKQTEIRIHSYPATVEHVQNMMYASKKELWRIVLCVGHFSRFRHAVDFFKSWSDKTRGCASRFSKCISLIASPDRHVRYPGDELILFVTPLSPFDMDSTFRSVERLRSKFFVSFSEVGRDDGCDEEEREEKEDGVGRTRSREDPMYAVTRGLVSRDIRDTKRRVLRKWWNNGANRKKAIVAGNDSGEDEEDGLHLVKLQDILSREIDEREKEERR